MCEITFSRLRHLQGAIPDAEVRQAIARVRDPVPRYLWAARFGPGKIGNGSCSYRDVAASMTRVSDTTLHCSKSWTLTSTSRATDYAANLGRRWRLASTPQCVDYRKELFQALRLEGHHLTTINRDLDRLYC
jgi:hypothetical protein